MCPYSAPVIKLYLTDFAQLTADDDILLHCKDKSLTRHLNPVSLGAWGERGRVRGLRPT